MSRIDRIGPNHIERIGPGIRQIGGVVAPIAVTVVAAVLLLRLLNALPTYWESLTSSPRSAPMLLAERLEYGSIEEAEADLGVKVLTPAFFPSYLQWPPASVRGQREPARVVSLLFTSTNGLQALQIRELYWPGDDLPFPVPEPAEVVARQTVGVNGTQGTLILGKGQSDTMVNQLRWRAGGVHLIATTIYPADDLLQIARSIHP